MKKDIRKKILIVEDEEKLRTTVSDFLKLYDYDIIEARDGEEAVWEFEEQMNEISLVLLDIMLPIYDGQFVLKKDSGNLRGAGHHDDSKIRRL